MEFIRIGKLLQDYYAVPDYQREYEWTNTENETLLDDVISLIQSGDNHFTGAIVSIPYDADNGTNSSIDFDEYGIDTQIVKHIVDGQQRLTSLSIMIRALRQIIESDENINQELKNNICEPLKRMLTGDKYKTDPTGGFIYAPTLVLSGNTGKCYNKEILNHPNVSYNGNYKGAKRLKKAFSFYLTELKTRRDELISEGIVSCSEDFYSKFIDVIGNNVQFVEIICNEASNAFQVFDSLNGKGLDLTAADRIKNILMSWSPRATGASKWEELVNKAGEDNLSNFFVALFFYNSKKRVSKNKLPDEFKKDYRESALSDFEFFFNALLEDGERYGKLKQCKMNSTKIDEALKDLQQLKNEQAYVMLFAALKHYDTTFSENDFFLYLESIIKLVVRMQVCEKSTNRLDKKFAEWIDMMKNQNASLIVITKKIDEYRTTICDDNMFESEFKKFSPNDNSISEYYIRCIENYKRKISADRTPVERGLTVEHIIPQGLDPKLWYEDEQVPEAIIEDFKNIVVENIGNKALLYGDDNSAASNNVYRKKREIYEKGKRGQNEGTPKDTFKIIAELLDKYPDRFKYEEVQDRAEEFAKCATHIW